MVHGEIAYPNGKPGIDLISARGIGEATFPNLLENRDLQRIFRRGD
jgi:hypothetical protein